MRCLFFLGTLFAGVLFCKAQAEKRAFFQNLYEEYRDSSVHSIDSMLKQIDTEVDFNICQSCQQQKLLLRSKLYYKKGRLPELLEVIENMDTAFFYNKKDQVDVLLLKGRSILMQSPDLANETIQRAYNLAKDIKDLPRQHEALSLMSINEMNQANYSKGIEYYHQAYSIAIAQQDSNSIFKSLMQQCTWLYKAEQYEDLLIRAKDLANTYSGDTVKMSKINFFLSISLFETGQFIESVRMQSYSIKKIDTTNELRYAAVSNMVNALLKIHDEGLLEEMKATLLKEPLLQDIIPEVKIDIYNSEEEYLLMLEQFVLYVKQYYDNRGLKLYQTYPYFYLGKIYKKRGNYKEAEKNFKQSLFYSNQLKNEVMEQIVAVELAELYERIGEYEKAFLSQKRAKTIEDSLGIGKEKVKIGYLTAKLEFDQKRIIDSLDQQRKKILTTIIQKEKASRIRTYTTFFIVLGVIVVLGIFVYLRKQKIESDYQFLLLEQKLLRTQMNPHFIFNSLTTIGSFVIGNKITESYNYISQFSKLMRLILESSRKEEITLQSELQIIENFLSLNHMNNKEKLTYELQYDEELKLKEITLPPMLLQPFIENAINYGVSKATGVCQIEVDFVLKDSVLYCRVRDYGDGFSEQKTDRERTSYAIQITQERIENIRKQTGKKVRFQIIDLSKDIKEEKGVLVEICVEI